MAGDTVAGDTVAGDTVKGLKIDADQRTVELNVREPHFYNNPYPYYEELRRRTPVFFWSDYQKWTFLNHRDVNAILRDRRFGRQISHVLPPDSDLIAPPRPELAPFFDVERFSMLQLEPLDHTRLRGLLQKAFVSRQVESLRPRIAELAHQFCDDVADALAAEGVCDLKQVFATPIPVIVVAEMLGIPIAMADHLLDWSHRMVKMYEPDCTTENEQAAVVAAQEFAEYLRRLVASRRQHPQDDLISHLIAVEAEGGRLTEDEILCNCILLMNAGHEATVNVIGNGVHALLTHRAQWDRWCAGPELSVTAVEELMRYDTPLHMFDRWVLEDLEFNGLQLEQGTEVSLVLGAANRDPAVFESADELKLDRPKNAHVSLGAGIHFCIGAPLARLELQTALPILMARFPELHLAEIPVYVNTYHFHGLESLLVS